MGQSIYINFSVIGIFLCFLYDWSRGLEIEMARSFSLFSIIYTLFSLVNQAMYYSLTATFQYLAILKRLGDIFKMEDVKKFRISQVEKNEVGIELK